MRSGLVSLSALALLAGASCARWAAEPVVHTGPDGRVRPVEKPAELSVITGAEAASRGLVARKLSISFPDGRDGTQLLGDFFAEAKRSGAVSVSDLEISLHHPDESAALRCSTRIVPRREVQQRVVPGHHVSRYVMQPVTRMVTEHEYRCHPESRMVTKQVTETQQECRSVTKYVQVPRTTYTSSYDAYSKSYRSTPHTTYVSEARTEQECHPTSKTRMVTDRVTEQRCGYQTVTRTVQRWEYQLKHNYVPPRLEEYSRFDLHESEPVCEPAVAGADLRHRIEGQIYFEPGDAPRERELTADEKYPGEQTEEAPAEVAPAQEQPEDAPSQPVQLWDSDDDDG